MLLYKFYLRFAPVTRLKFQFFPRPNFLHAVSVTSRKGPLMKNTAAYTRHVNDINTRVTVEYQNELWRNSQSIESHILVGLRTFVRVTQPSRRTRVRQCAHVSSNVQIKTIGHDCVFVIHLIESSPVMTRSNIGRTVLQWLTHCGPN